MDGRIMGENLTRMGIDEAWLQMELKKKGYKSPKEIFLAIYRPSDKKTVFYKNED
jgi:uncharacterized membrane protein YcaP (DUF421 family)